MSFGTIRRRAGYLVAVYTNGVSIKDYSFDGYTRVTTDCAKPYKVAVMVSVLSGMLAADGASYCTKGTFLFRPVIYTYQVMLVSIPLQVGLIFGATGNRGRGSIGSSAQHGTRAVQVV
jgi:hypothetical protein